MGYYSDYHGVSKQARGHGKWCAYLSGPKHVGVFETEHEAAMARDLALLRRNGPMAGPLNLPAESLPEYLRRIERTMQHEIPTAIGKQDEQRERVTKRLARNSNTAEPP